MRAAPLALALSLAACWDVPAADWSPQSVVERLRILGVRAEPPEIAPGAKTTLDALVVDALGRAFTHVWLVCDPDPAAALGSACARLDTARQAADLLASPPPGVRVVAGPSSIEYTAPADALDTLPANAPERITGVTATVALLVFTGADPQAPGVERQVALKRVKVRAPDAYTNANPRLAQLLANGHELTGDRVFARGAEVGLAALAAPGSRQEMLRLLPDGSTLVQEESLVFSWLTTTGRFVEEELGARTDEGEVISLLLPPDGGEVPVFAVLRDARGGIDWARRTLAVP